MLDVGWGEMLLLAGVALVIFGPDKLPKAAADAGRMVRKLREMANSAQDELGPGLDINGIKNDLKSVADLHPKRIMGSALSDVTNSVTKPAQSPVPVESQNVARSTSGTTPGAPTSKRRVDPDAT